MKSPKSLKTLAAGKPPWPAIDVDKAIPWVEQRTKLALADSQKAALRVALVSNVMVITGGRGVGKNHAGQLTAEDSDRQYRHDRALYAYRSCRKASVREQWLRGQNNPPARRNRPRTGSFRRNEDEPLDRDLPVVDEISTVAVPLMRAVLRALPERVGTATVGDVDQLPSVGPGQALGDIICLHSPPPVDWASRSGGPALMALGNRPTTPDAIPTETDIQMSGGSKSPATCFTVR
jgi:exodeoxyribonuclease V alpha subunit